MCDRTGARERARIRLHPSKSSEPHANWHVGPALGQEIQIEGPPVALPVTFTGPGQRRPEVGRRRAATP
jgi:hypothetical protein